MSSSQRVGVEKTGRGAQALALATLLLGACAGSDATPEDSVELGSVTFAAGNGSNGGTDASANGANRGGNGAADAGGPARDGGSNGAADAGNGGSNGAADAGNGAADAGNGGSDGAAGAGANGGGDGGGTVVFGATPSNVDIRRSLVVTEQPLLAGFSLERVMNQLVAQSGVPGLTALSLFQQWWDTQNPGPGLGLGPHCDDTVDGTYGPVLNGYPYPCRSTLAEGGEASCDPFAVDSPCKYIPVALFNRFDMAPMNGAHCGEHRIVYARDSGRTVNSMRNLVIFEAVLPNPHPGQGLKGCKKIADFWGDLSKDNSLTSRAAALEAFYFNGVANVPPVVHVDHLGNNPNSFGQIRTNQFIQPLTLSPRSWSFREFKLIKTCVEGACDLDMVPVTNKTNPFGPLFNAAWTDPGAAAFQAYFPSVIGDLSATTLPGLRMDIPDVYNSGQSQASGGTETNYLFNFGTAPSAFRTALETALIGSALSPDDIVARAQTQSCAGCHRLSNNANLGGGLIWPPSLGFTHVSERDIDLEVVDGVTRYKLSVALEQALLPHRKLVLDDYINNPPPNANSSKSIGGSTSH